jgi:tetratricopeptide (TPR) repeat protein
LEYAKTTIELNKKAEEMEKNNPKKCLYETATKSKLTHNSKAVKLTTIDTPLEKMSEAQLIENFEFDLKILEAEISLWTGATQFNDNSYFKGAYNLRKSWKAYESLLKFVEKEDMKAQDNDPATIIHKDLHQSILLGVGMFYYMLSVLPPTMTKVLEFIGFKKNRELGIEYMDYVACERGLRSGSCIFMLSFNYLFIPTALSDKKEQLERYRPHLDFVTEAYPESGFFLFVASQYARKMGEYEQAVEHIKKAIESCQRNNFDPHTYHFELGQCSFVLQDYESAAKTFEYLVNREESFDMKAFSGIALAVCYSKLDQWNKALEIIQQIPKLISKKSRFDEFVVAKLKVLDSAHSDMEKKLVLTLTLFDMLYLKRDIHHMKPDMTQLWLKDFESTIDPELSSVKLGDVKAAALVIKAALVKTSGNEEQAAQLFDQVLSMDKEVKHEKQWLASAAYERGEQEYYKHQLEQSRNYLKRAEGYSKYPFEEVIRSRAKIALDQVKKQLQ